MGQLLSRPSGPPSAIRARWVACAVLGSLLLAGCGGDPEESTLQQPTSPSSIDLPAEVDTVPEDAPFICELLTDEQIVDLIGVSVVGIDGEGDTCTWTLTESAAVLGGPNEGGEASLEATFIDPEELASSEADDEPGIDVAAVEDVGDEAFIVRRDGLPPTTLFVRDGERALSLSLANVLDGGHATEQALVDMADLILGASS